VYSSFYTPEDDSGVYLDMADGSGEPLFSSEVLNTELFYALCQKESRGYIKSGWAERLHQKFRSDVENGRLVLLAVGHDVLAQAVEVARRCYAQTPPHNAPNARRNSPGSALAAKCTEIVTPTGECCKELTCSDCHTKRFFHPC